MDKIIIRKRLFTGTVPVNKKHPTGTVPVNKEQVTSTVPVIKKHLTGTLKNRFFFKFSNSLGIFP